ncbi:hypothetical protein MY4038_008191 [Beauveria bassiana]
MPSFLGLVSPLPPQPQPELLVAHVASPRRTHPEGSPPLLFRASSTIGLQRRRLPPDSMQALPRHTLSSSSSVSTATKPRKTVDQRRKRAVDHDAVPRCEDAPFGQGLHLLLVGGGGGASVMTRRSAYWAMLAL